MSSFSIPALSDPQIDLPSPPPHLSTSHLFTWSSRTSSLRAFSSYCYSGTSRICITPWLAHTRFLAPPIASSSVRLPRPFPWTTPPARYDSLSNRTIIPTIPFSMYSNSHRSYSTVMTHRRDHCAHAHLRTPVYDFCFSTPILLYVRYSYPSICALHGFSTSFSFIVSKTASLTRIPLRYPRQ